MPINKCSITFVVFFSPSFFILDVFSMIPFHTLCNASACIAFLVFFLLSFAPFVFIDLISITHYRHFKSCCLCAAFVERIFGMFRDLVRPNCEWISCSCSWLLIVDFLYAIDLIDLFQMNREFRFG